MIHVRPYRPDDAPALMVLFRTTVRRVNRGDYSEEQVRAWAPDALDIEAWAARFAGRFAVVAEIGGEVAGFADLEPVGHLDRFFVSADHQGRGVGRALMASVLAEARHRGLDRVRADVSLTARRFFERSGFALVEARVVTVRGVELRNFRMEWRGEAQPSARTC